MQTTLRTMGYAYDSAATHALVGQVQTIWWFRSTLMVFRRDASQPSVSLHDLWPSWKWEMRWTPGFCSRTDEIESPGDSAEMCVMRNSGSWKVRSPAGAHDIGMRACERRCRECARCRFFSYSVDFGDCDWFAACDLGALKQSVSFASGARMYVDHLTLVVRASSTSTT